MSDHDQGHEGHTHEHDESFGMALGFRIVEDGGQLFLAEAEITPYVDQPTELGVTLVFHPLEGLDPVETSEEEDRPAWPLDIDDELTRNGSEPIAAQFQAILRQLRGLSEDALRDYLRLAREEE